LTVVLLTGVALGGRGGSGNAAAAPRPGHGGLRAGAAGIAFVELAPNGGTVGARGTSGLAVAMGYAGNDSVAGTVLTLDAGVATAGIPRPPDGAPVLFLRFVAGGTRNVMFANSVQSAMLRSPLLRPDIAYSIYLFADGLSVGVPYDAGKPTNGVLRFPSPLANLSLPPRVPLIVEVVTGGNGANNHDKPVCRSSTLNPASSGGTIHLPSFATWRGTFAYAQNNARGPRVALTLANCGETNWFHAPTPPPSSGAQPGAGGNGGATPDGIHGPSTPELYLAVQVSRTKKNIDFSAATLNASLESVHLVAGKTYTLFLFSGSQPLGTIPLGVVPPNNTVNFSSPLAGVSIGRKTPLFLEVMETSAP
jgi:hypothetical protein